MVAQASGRHAKVRPIASETGTQLKVDEEGTGGAALPITPQDTSSYIISMIAELRSLAKASQFKFLTYLLEMAFQEGFRLAGELERSQGKSQPEPHRSRTASSP
jgi:hypothetical protein